MEATERDEGQGKQVRDGRGSLEAAERIEARGSSCGEKLEKKVHFQKITPHTVYS